MRSKAQEEVKQFRMQVVQALRDAATSLRTASRWQERTDRTPDELWPFLRERTKAAEDALQQAAAMPSESGGDDEQ